MARHERDARPPFPGGSDRWDRGPAGDLITADFFSPQPPPPAGGQLRFWSGTDWCSRPVLVWTGSSWTAKPARRWSGTAWLLT